MDTYFVTLMSVYEICNGNYKIKEESLVDELHKMVKQMYEESLIPHL